MTTPVAPQPKRAGSSWFRSSRSSTPAPEQQLSKQLEQTGLGESSAAGGGEGDEGGELGDLAGVGDELQGETETEAGKFKVLLGILRKTISIKDLTSVRISLPASMMEPIGNLEHWTYIDRPDYFAAMGVEDDELERFLGVLRWLWTKELKFAKHPIAKPFNSILGEHFHCYYDTPVLALHPKTGLPAPTVHLDENPHNDVVASAGRASSSNGTAAAALKSSPSVTSINSLSSGKLKSEAVLPSSASTTSARSGKSVASSAASFKSTAGAEDAGTARVVIVNEQTSHHPPISHFLVEARVEGSDGKKRTVRCRGVDQLSAKFTGANVKIMPGPHNHGLFVELPERNEEYQITHPTAAVAGLLRAAPYATICDSTFVSVGPADPEQRKKEKAEAATPEGQKRRRLRAILTYTEESWISRPRFLVEGVVYQSSPNEAASRGGAVEGEDKRFTRIKDVPKERVVGTLTGNWRGEIKWQPVGGSATTLVDLLPLAVVPKAVAPLSDQDDLETRKVWAPVCEALLKKEYSVASKEKMRIEQEQRDRAEERKKNGETYRPTYFEPEPEDVADWDGRPRLSAAGLAALERDFKAEYSVEPMVKSD